MNLKSTISLILLLSTVLFSCKRKDDPKPTPTNERANLTRDSIFLYAKQVYLWNDALPSYETFNPRKYTSESTDLANYEKELFVISQLKVNPATGSPFEYDGSAQYPKYSYIFEKSSKNPSASIPNKQSAVDEYGNGNDYGLHLSAYGQGGTTFALFVTAVYQNSPADKAGMIRSDRIYKINGRAIGDNSNTDLPFINSTMNGSSPITLEGVKYVNGASAGSYTVTLNKAVYKSSPVYGKKIFNLGAKKIGYFSFARFSELANAKTDIDLAFSEFATGGVTDLIVDFRYNGGGFLTTAELLLNHIAPASANGKVMYSEHFNSLMQSGAATILSNQPLVDAAGKIIYQNGRMVTYADISYTVQNNTELFTKTSSFNADSKINNIVFIVSDRTASASEMVINALKPYMNVKIVGTKTYGKPVGWFPMTMENKYDVYYPLFQTKNALGQGDYFDGLTPDVDDDFDDPRNNFGDPKEYYTSLAVNLISPGGVVTNAAKTMSIQGRSVSVESLKPMAPLAGANSFFGMIETKHHLK